MQCPRWAGLRVPEIIAEGMSRALAMRCVHCGDVIDHIIVMNRQRHRHVTHGRHRTPIFGSPRRAWSRPVWVYTVPDIRLKKTQRNRTGQKSV